MKIFGFAVHAVVLTFLASASASNERKKIDPHYCKPNPVVECEYFEATGFKPWSTLAPKQVELLKPYLQDNYGITNPNAEFTHWAEDNDDIAASFLALTASLGRLQLVYKDGTMINALEMIIKLNLIEGDRFRVELDRNILERWKNDGGRFVINRADGKIETGKRDFVDHTVWYAASLHAGYDIQWWSSAVKAPRIQVNYRYKDSEADIDLDVATFIWGFIPNPKHLSYAGSDTRQFFKDFVNKYGDPGFKIALRQIQASNQ